MKLRTGPLFKKYFTIFFLFIIIPGLFLYGITFFYSSNMQKNIVKSQMQINVSEKAEMISTEVNQLCILSSVLINSKNLSELCKKYVLSNDNKTTFNTYEKIESELTNLFLYTNKKAAICIILENSEKIILKNSSIFDYVNFDDLIDSGLSNAIDKSPNFLIVNPNFFEAHEVSSKVNFSIQMAVNIESDYENYIDKIVFLYNCDFIDSFVKKENNVFNGCFYLTKKDNNELLLSKDSEILPIIQNEKNYYVEHSLPTLPWNLNFAIDIYSLYNALKGIQIFFIIEFLLLIFFYIVYTFIFFNQLISPLNLLIHNMQSVSDGDYSVRIKAEGHKEIKNLFSGFNKMVNQIQLLREHEKEQDEYKAKLELQVLQYQINPHFISNSLNSIRLMAVVNKNNNIAKMAASMVEVFNNTFRDFSKEISLHEEIKVLENYVYVMQIRFSQKIVFRYDIPENLKSYTILKMLLQPLVENSVIHGFSQKVGRGIIYIRATQKDNFIEIDVIDNGKGYKEKDQSEHFKKEDSLTRIGINNIEKRIKLNYGQEAALIRCSKPNHYTKVTLRLPVNQGSCV